MLKDMYYPDGKSLHKLVVGQSGSGKSYFIEETVKAFLKGMKDPDFRMVYFSPKNEGFIDMLDRSKSLSMM